MPRWSSYARPAADQMKAVRRAMAQAGTIVKAHNGQADPNVAPCVPKYNLTVPQSTPQGACWNGSEVQVDIIIDKSIGKALNYNLQFDLTLANSDVSGNPHNAYLASSASFITRVDWLYAGSVIETIYAPNMLYESIAMNTDQTLAQQAPLWAIDIDTANQVKPITVAVPGASSVKKTYYLPLSGVIPTAQMFVAGLTGELRIRLYLAPSILCRAGALVTHSTVTASLNALNLWTEEATMSEEGFHALKEQHRSGVSYRSVIRSLWQKTQPTLTAGQTQNDILNAFTNDSAALLVWVNNPNLDPGYFLTRQPLNTLQLLDAGGATLTRVLPSSLVESTIAPSQTPLGSNFVNSSTFTTYFIPFSSSLNRVLDGKVLGGLRLTGSEQLVINSANTVSGYLENVVSFDYASLKVENGELTWSKTAGDL